LKKRPSGWPRNICKAGLDRCFSFPYTILNMSARKVLWIVLGATVLLWGGVFVYLLKPSQTSLPNFPSQITTRLPNLLPTSPFPASPSATRSYITINQPNQFMGFHLQATLEGTVKEINKNYWLISGKNGGEFTIKPTGETNFIFSPDRKRQTEQKTDKNTFKVGDTVEVKAIKVLLPQRLYPKSPVVGNDLSTWLILEIRRFP